MFERGCAGDVSLPSVLRALKSPSPQPPNSRVQGRAKKHERDLHRAERLQKVMLTSSKTNPLRRSLKRLFTYGLTPILFIQLRNAAKKGVNIRTNFYRAHKNVAWFWLSNSRGKRGKTYWRAWAGRHEGYLRYAENVIFFSWHVHWIYTLFISFTEL